MKLVSILCAAYKDVDSKKKQGVSKKSTYGCRSVFLAIDSLASADTKDIFKRFRSIAEAQSYIMHSIVPSFAKAISGYFRVEIFFEPEPLVSLLQLVSVTNEEGCFPARTDFQVCCDA